MPPFTPKTAVRQVPEVGKCVTADEFLTEIFCDIPGRVVLCRPNGDYFDQQFWERGLCATLPPGCWYFCIATVTGLAEDGKVRRRFVDLCRHGCIVLDDVGTKIDRDLVTLPPSWVLESSPGNCQVGYILDSGMNPGSARLMLAALADAKLMDAGAKAVTQPFRLPGALNFKHDPPFAARLIVWEPQTRYLPSEIARAYRLGPKPKPIPPRPVIRTSFCDDDDPVWRALQRGNYLLSDRPRNGWYAIRCPWENEHGDHSMDGKPDSGIAYNPRHAGLGAAFKCFHGACAARGWRDLYDLLVRP